MRSHPYDVGRAYSTMVEGEYILLMNIISLIDVVFSYNTYLINSLI